MDDTTTPFRLQMPQTALDDLHRRLSDTRWPHPVPGREDPTDFSRGIPAAYLRELAEYWSGASIGARRSSGSTRFPR